MLTITVYYRYGAAAKEHQRLFYNEAGFLLMLALADGALFGYDTIDDFRQTVIPDGDDQVILRFKDSALDLLVCRKCTKSSGVTDDLMSQSTFRAIVQSTLVNAGYFWNLAIHAIRRDLGKKVDSECCTLTSAAPAKNSLL